MTIDEKTSSQGLVWRNISNPKEESMEALQYKYGFHDLDLEDCLSKTESAKIEEHNNYIFILLHFPIKHVKKHHISIESLSIFIGQDFFITVSNGHLRKLDEFFNKMRKNVAKRKKVFKKGSGFLLYELIDELFDTYNPYINQLNRYMHEIEEDIFEGKIQKDRLYDIMNVKRQLITLKRALLPHSTVITTLEHLHKRFISKKLELYFDDIVDKITRGTVTLESMDEMVETLHNANESLTSHNTNRVMKILTIFSVTMLPLTFLTGIYGMNVSLPIANQANAFNILVGIMVTILIFSYAFFKVKRYL